MVDYRLVSQKLLELVNVLLKPPTTSRPSARTSQFWLKGLVLSISAMLVVGLACLTANPNPTAKIALDHPPVQKPIPPVVFVININHYHTTNNATATLPASEPLQHNQITVNFIYNAEDKKISKELFNLVR